jgi:hypothetical protein
MVDDVAGMIHLTKPYQGSGSEGEEGAVRAGAVAGTRTPDGLGGDVAGRLICGAPRTVNRGGAETISCRRRLRGPGRHLLTTSLEAMCSLIVSQKASDDVAGSR